MPSTGDAATASAAPATTTTPPVDVTPAPDEPVPTTTALPDTGGSTPPGFDPSGGAQVAYAVADLAAMLGVAETAITVVVREEVVWPDGAIGCPQPGMSYTQALVEGSRIVLEYEGTRHAYHAAALGEPFYCVNPA